MSEIEGRGIREEDESDETALPEETDEQDVKVVSPLYKWAALVGVVVGLGVGAFFLTRNHILPLIEASPIGARLTQFKQNRNVPKMKVWEGEIVNYAVEGITVNAMGSRGLQFVVFDLNLEIPEEATEELDRRNSQIRGALLSYFVERTVDELVTADFHSAAPDSMRTLINSVMEGEPVDTAYFTYFVIQ